VSVNGVRTAQAGSKNTMIMIITKPLFVCVYVHVMCTNDVPVWGHAPV